MTTTTTSTFYDTLGVPQTANLDDIKKAYRRLSFIHHPDKNNNNPESTILFQKIAQAYTVLSNPSAREEYDNELKYSAIFGGGGDYGGIFGGWQPRKSQHPQQHQQQQHHAHINPHELFNMLFNGMDGGIGSILHGLGGLGSGEIHIIHGGSGGGNIGFHNLPHLSHIHPMAAHMQTNMHHQFMHPSASATAAKSAQEPAPEPVAEPAPEPITQSIDITYEQAYVGGTVVVEYERLIYENKTASTIKRESVAVAIPRGARDKEKIIIPNVGNISANRRCGELHFTLNVLPHAIFTRDSSGNDLILHKNITLKESLCGTQFEFTHINGKSYQIINKTPGTVIPPETIKIINGLGFIRDASTVGSLQIVFHVVYPETISTELCEALSSIL